LSTEEDFEYGLKLAAKKDAERIEAIKNGSYD
jgi:hypothetical protein